MKIVNQVCIVALILMAAMIAHQAIQAYSPSVDPVAPTVAKAIRVLIIAKSGEPYTKEQSAAINSARSGDIDAWFRLNCAQVNGNPERRVFDPDEDVTKESRFWQDAMKHDHGETLPEVETYVNRHWNKPHTFKDSAELMSILGGAKSND